MGKISVGRDDDGEGPSNSTRKRRKVSLSWLCSQRQGSETEDPSGTEDEEQEDNDGGEDPASEQHAADDDGDPYSDGGGSDEPVSVRPGSNGNGGENVGSATDERDRYVPALITDPDVFDCCICYEPLSPPVFQCENGHIACSNCCTRIGNKCPMCSMPIGYSRCRAIEKVLESLKMSCLNAKYGCKEIFSYSRKKGHENKCIYLPCSCPHSGCDFVAASKELSLHFSHRHVGSGIQFIYDRVFSVSFNIHEKAMVLQEQNDATLFILHNKHHPLGNMVNLSCIGPNSEPQFHFEMMARSWGRSVKLQSFTENIQRGYADTPSTGVVLIPSSFFGSGLIKLDILIRCNAPRPADAHKSWVERGRG